MALLHRTLFGALTLAALAPLAQAQTAQKLFFEGDMVRGAGAHTGPGCVLTSQFKRTEQIAWRVRVTAADGQKLDDKGLKSLEVEMSDGQKFPLHYGSHPRGGDSDRFWSVSWVIPEDYPTGSFAYKVVATDLGGKATTWEPFNVKLSLLTVIPGAVEAAK